MNKGFKLSMIISSFFPMWISIFLTTVNAWITNENGFRLEDILNFPFVIISFILLLKSIIVTCVLLSKIDRIAISNNDKDIVLLKEYKKCKNITVEYMLAIILPLLAFDFNQVIGWVLFLIFYLTIMYLNYRNNYFFVNIFLEMKGYYYYECTIVTKYLGPPISQEMFMISKKINHNMIDQYIEIFKFDNSTCMKTNN